jgi:(2Fe-2S) ferredoxin
MADRRIFVERRHIFVCTNAVASGKPACGRRGDAIVRAIATRMIARTGAVRVTGCGCLGACFDGPAAVVYPEAVWYGALDERDADALADHLVDGRVYDAKRIPSPGSGEE